MTYETIYAYDTKEIHLSKKGRITLSRVFLKKYNIDLNLTKPNYVILKINRLHSRLGFCISKDYQIGSYRLQTTETGNSYIIDTSTILKKLGVKLPLQKPVILDLIQEQGLLTFSYESLFTEEPCYQ